MSNDVVPPGGDRPIEDEPWPARTASVPAGVTVRDLPQVPTTPPADVETPADWRTMHDQSPVPPGYRGVGAPALYARTRADRWGIVSCVCAVAGLGQLAIVYLPFVSVLAVVFGLVGRREASLDPEGVRSRGAALIGIVLGAFGIVAGIALYVRYGTFTSIVDV